VAIDLKAIEQLATDQSSLKAAAELVKPAKWSSVGVSHDRAGLGRMRGLRRQSVSRDGRPARSRQQVHLPIA
jgi:hypothetical protein